MRTVGLAAPHPAAVAAGEAAVAAGGNAVDAALAAAAVLAVLHPQDTSIGGDAIALVAPPEGAPTAYLGVGRTAAGLDVERFSRMNAMPARGVDPVTVPGVVGLWGQLHGQHARRPWALLLQPAIELAGAGAPVSTPLARAIAENQDAIAADPGLTALLNPDGIPLRRGDRLHQPALAGSLNRLAAEGPAEFYRGVVGDGLIRALRRRGSALTAADLADHRTLVSRPLSRTWGESTVWAPPPPSQGYALLLGLAVAESLADPLGRDAAGLAAGFALISEHRDGWLADAPSGERPWEEPLTSELIASAKRFRPGAGRRTHRASGDTVAIVAIDSDGLAVSLIQSVFHAFGAGILDPATGILVHNRGASFSVDARQRSMIAPGRRPPHTLLPVLMRGPEGTTAVGTMGGLAQPQILTQVLLQIAAGREPADAVAAARWTLGSIERGGDGLQLEPGLPSDARESLLEAGWAITELEAGGDEVGHAQVVHRDAGGTINAGVDPRTSEVA